MYRIADLSIGNASIDCCYEFEFQGKHFEVQRFGTNFSTPYMKELIVALHNQVDAISISHMPPMMRIRDRAYAHREYLEIMATPCNIPLCNGSQLKELATVNAIMAAIENQDLVPEAGIFFPLALLHLEVIYALADYAKYIGMGDSYSVLGIPWIAKPGVASAYVAKAILTMANLREIKSQTPLARSKFKQQTRAALTGQVKKYQYIFSDVGPLVMFGEDLDFIKGKDVIITENHFFEARLHDYQPRKIINLFPKNFSLHKHINYSVLDATLRLAYNKTAPLSLEEWQKLLNVTTQTKEYTQRHILGCRPSPAYRMTSTVQKVRTALRSEKAPDFAFIVHPLSQSDLFKAAPLKPIKFMPGFFRDGLEKYASRAPGFTYGHIKGIVSNKTHKEVSGVIYGLLSTPKMMLREPPEVTYAKIENLCHHAAGLGAKIIGLGAYTKVIGDSGESINRNSPIPVTTGNSLSASATLWAVHEVVRKMGLVKPSPGSQLLDATATVIGATGSIGKVSAKLLSLAFGRLCLIAPRLDRLEEVLLEIKQISPRCKIILGTNSNAVAKDTDVLVTATSAFDQKIIDVDFLKPGCVVCDCSRPLDFTAEDAQKRPDILIIESGEVILPGPVQLTCDLGLPDDSVYACLGETALLAMENDYEAFTLGRNIDWLKVKRIYQLALEHGVKLAAIRGHSGFISDKEIAITREHAIRKLGKR